MSGSPPEITDEFILSVYPPPLSLRGTNSTLKQYLPLYSLLNLSTEFL